MPTHRVTVLLNDKQYAHVRSNAGLIPLSTWFRNLAINYADAIQSKQYQWVKPDETTRHLVDGVELKAGTPDYTAAAIENAREVYEDNEKYLTNLKVSKRPNHYCKPHHQMGCVAEGCRLGT